MGDPVDILSHAFPKEPEPQLKSPSNPFSLSFRPSKQSHAFGSLKPTQPWFDVKVFYIRVSSCFLKDAPNSLLIVYPKREINSELEVNGGRISPLERACFPLRRDRVDRDSAEVTYVNTNNLRTTGDLAFEVYDGDELVLSGSLSRLACGKDHRLLVEAHSSISTELLSNEAGWNMDCSCSIKSQACCFLKGKLDFSTSSPIMEVYVAGRSLGLPIILTQTVQLTARKKNARCLTLDVIPEEETSRVNNDVPGQVADDNLYSKLGDQAMTLGLPSSLYLTTEGNGLGEGEEGELSSFNAGVRVGVGLGLGMCLGVGIGLSLLVRTYSAATGSFRKRLL